MQHPQRVESIAFSPNGEILTSACWDGIVYLWDVSEQKQIGVLQGHKDCVKSVAISSDGKCLASGSDDGTILLWEMNLPVPGKAVEPEGKRLTKWGEMKKTALYQNYPNPFNPETWIPFRLAKPSDVTISIYSQSGQLARRLSLGYKEEGAYMEKSRAGYWDGRNDKDEPVASGVYFYKLDAGDFAQTRKMVVLR